MTGHSDDAMVLELLAPLGRLAPVPFSGSEQRRRRLGRPILAAAIVVAALVLAGVAIADGFGAFDGIGAAQRPQTPADRLEPKDLPQDCHSGSRVAAGSMFCHLILSSARLLRTVPVGGKLWAVTDTRGDLCVILQYGGASCGSGLTRGQPTTITSFRLNDQTPSISWGITLDSVAAVSFPAGGREVTVPVENNVWFFQGDASGLASMLVHFTDGSTERPDSDVPSSG